MGRDERERVADEARITGVGPYFSSAQVQDRLANGKPQPPGGYSSVRVYMPWLRLSERERLEAAVVRFLNDLRER